MAALPARTRAVLVLDAAGWSRADVAGHLGVSERVVKRLLDRHRAGAVAAAGAAVGGADCERFAGTLQGHAGAGRRLRPDGPLHAHLEVCDACRLALVRARALRALLPAPPAAALALPAAPLAALKLGAAVVAAISAAGGAALLVQPTGAAHTIPPARATIVTPAPAPAAVAPRPQRVTTVSVATRPHRAPAARPPRRGRHRVAAPVPRHTARHRTSGCDLGTLGTSGLGC